MEIVRVKGLKMTSHFNCDMRMIGQLIISFSVNQCIAKENTLQSRTCFRHISLNFAKLINNNLVKYMFIINFVCFY